MAEDDLVGYAITSCYKTLGQFAVSQIVMFLAVIILLVIVIILAIRLARVQIRFDIEKSLLVEKLSKMLAKEVGRNGIGRKDKVLEEEHKDTGRGSVHRRKSNDSSAGKRQRDSGSDEKGSDNMRGRTVSKKTGSEQ